MLENLEHLRVLWQDEQDAALASKHFPKLLELAEQVRQVRPEEARTAIQLLPLATLEEEWNKTVAQQRSDYESEHFIVLLDGLCRIYQLSNQTRVRRLIDSYQAEWKG